MEDQLFDFDTWFDLFTSHLKKKGYTGPLDKETFEEDYEDGKSPEEAGDKYYDEYLA